ncbi:hypothetical protein ACFV3E_39935 [Streptomyces sp. NPDC059718]
MPLKADPDDATALREQYNDITPRATTWVGGLLKSKQLADPRTYNRHA